MQQMINSTFNFISDTQLIKLFEEQVIPLLLEHNLIQNTEDQQPKIVDLDGLLEARPMVGSRSTVYKKAAKGEIPHSKSGKRLIFDLHVIDQWLLSNPVKTSDELVQETEEYFNKRFKNRK